MHPFLRKLHISLTLILGFPVLVLAQVDITSSNIPIVVINTDSQEIVDEYRIVANMGIIDNGEGALNHITDPFNDYSGKISIEIRGSTSQAFPKKSYGFETQDESGENRNVSLINLPEENDWILYAPYSDKTLIRNILAYRLARELGQYAPRTKLCELIVNGEYKGVYVLIEKIKRDKNRVDISELNPDEISGDDVSGGYIIKIDKQTGDSGPVWESELGGIYFQYEYPKYDEIVPEQKDYIKDYIDEFEQALTGDHFADPETGYRKYMDERSLVDFFLINELSRNVDAYMLSTFFHKDKDSNGGKLNMGPIWDFNLSFGNADYRDAFKIHGFQVSSNPSSWWWNRFLEDSSFISDVKNRWYSVRESQFSNDSIFTIIDSLATLLDQAQERNFMQWNLLGYKVWPNYYVGENYGDEVEILKTWTSGRMEWLDSKLQNWTDIEKNSVPSDLNVYPNPFNNHLNFSFSLNRPGDISIALYNLNGTMVSRIFEGKNYPAGSHSIDWQTTEIPASLYVLILKVDGQVVSSRKVVKL